VIQKLEITARHLEIDSQLRKYAIKKLGDIDGYIPKHSRDSAHLEVLLSQSKINGKQEATCEVTLYMPHETINITESAMNMYSAVDIVKVKLKLRIQKYKDESMSGKQRRHIFGRLRRHLSSKLPGR
jgi:ribosomal subunit interface protein